MERSRMEDLMSNPASQMTLEALRSVPLFASLDDDSARDLRSLLSEEVVPQNTRLFRQGDSGDAMYLIESGRVRITIRDEDKQEVTLAELAQGDFFGEMSIIDGRKRSADAKVTEDSRLAVLSREAFLSFVRKKPDVALEMLSATSGFFRTNERNASRDRTARRESSVTFASAERLRPSMIDISPKKSPWANSASVTSCLSSSRIVMRTRPLSIRYIASPLSPCRNRRVFCGTTSSESRLRKSRAESSSSEAKSGTERSASSVIWLAGFDMR